jgi:hypothetical protein
VGVNRLPHDLRGAAVHRHDEFLIPTAHYHIDITPVRISFDIGNRV